MRNPIAFFSKSLCKITLAEFLAMHKISRQPQEEVMKILARTDWFSCDESVEAVRRYLSNQADFIQSQMPHAILQCEQFLEPFSTDSRHIHIRLCLFISETYPLRNIHAISQNQSVSDTTKLIYYLIYDPSKIYISQTNPPEAKIKICDFESHAL